MTRFLTSSAALLFGAFTVLAADSATLPVNKIYGDQLKSVEREVVSLAEAMPADKYAFAPTQGEFKGVRTFSMQMSHIAAVMNEVAAAMLEEKNPSEMGPSENGPTTLQGKAAVVKYLKDAFAYAHKAMGALNDKNLTATIKSPFGEGQVARAYLANVILWHAYDHYGQAVVYARMNGIVPPASR